MMNYSKLECESVPLLGVSMDRTASVSTLWSYPDMSNWTSHSYTQNKIYFALHPKMLT